MTSCFQGYSAFFQNRRVFSLFFFNCLIWFVCFFFLQLSLFHLFLLFWRSVYNNKSKCIAFLGLQHIIPLYRQSQHMTIPQLLFFSPLPLFLSFLFLPSSLGLRLVLPPLPHSPPPLLLCLRVSLQQFHLLLLHSLSLSLTIIVLLQIQKYT